VAAGSGPNVAVRQAQQVLQRSSPTLIVDGRWGSYTHAAYERAPGEDQVEVDAILTTHGYTAEELIRANRAAKAARDEAYLAVKQQAREARAQQSPNAGDRAAVTAAIQAAAKQTGIPESWLTTLVRLESGFNPRAINGSSRGLMQIQPAAWKDVQQIDPSVGDYNSNVWDPAKNALVGARYLMLNRDRLRRYGFAGEPTLPELYLAHQQGAAGFMELWKISRGVPVRTNHVTEEKMRRNPPQDRQGVTTDKADFYRRWLAVAERKLGSS
jgi:hypothetical protein